MPNDQAMPRIQWSKLPWRIRNHLLERRAERQISTEELGRLKLWIESDPEVPDGPWYKDFGSFKVCGAGSLPKTFLLRGQPAKGECLD
jgi:hypothetical protein